MHWLGVRSVREITQRTVSAGCMLLSRIQFILIAFADELTFRRLQRRGVPDVQLVAENEVVRRIAVVVVA